MILTRGDVKEIVVEAIELLVELEEAFEKDPDMTAPQMRRRILARMKEWKEREL